MGSNTKIEWATKVWNPVRGCSRVSEGCRNCYAERQAMRFSGKGQPYEGLVQMQNGHPQWTGKIRTVPEALEEPLRWRKPQRVFVNSMSDLFHENIEFPFLAAIYATMLRAPQHQFLVLTKRPDRALEFSRKAERLQIFADITDVTHRPWPLPNLWLGVSVEDQATAENRIYWLLKTPAAVRWVSYEPALGAVDFLPYFRCNCGRDPKEEYFAPAWSHAPYCPHRARLHWIVAGGESGPGARPAHPDWFRRVRDDCRTAGVPFFFKQWGAYTPNVLGENDSYPPTRLSKQAAGRSLDGREWNEFPAPLAAASR